MDKHGITILYHLHQCRPCTSQDIFCAKDGKGGINIGSTQYRILSSMYFLLLIMFSISTYHSYLLHKLQVTGQLDLAQARYSP